MSNKTNADQANKRTAKMVTPAATKKNKGTDDAADFVPRQLDMTMKQPGIALPVWRDNIDDCLINNQKDDKFYVRFFHIQAESPALNGFVIMCDGYGENFMTAPLFKKPVKPEYTEFLRNVNPVPYVLKAFKNGQPWMKPDYDKQYNCLAVLFGEKAIANGLIVNEELFRSFFVGTLLPSMKLIGDFNAGKEPVFDTIESYHTLPNWSTILDDDAIKRIVNMVYVRNKNKAKKSFSSVSEFFKSDIKNVYSCYARGSVPKSFITNNNLTATHLDVVDINFDEDD